MALQIAKESKFGITATYWKIVRGFEDWLPEGHFTITLYGWVDRDAREEYPQTPIIVKEVELSPGVFLVDPTRQDIYDVVKLIPEWQGAIDC